MQYILTLVSSDAPLTAGHLAVIERHIDFGNSCGMAGDPVWLSPHKAADIPLLCRPDAQEIAELRDTLATNKIDLFITPSEGRRKKLLLADMDSTIVTGETLDDLADFVGLKTPVSAITRRAMEGKLNFHEALRERIALLAGLSEGKIAEALTNTQLSKGAETFVNHEKTWRYVCVGIWWLHSFHSAYCREMWLRP